MKRAPKIFHTLHQKVTDTQHYNINVMLCQFGLFISVGLLTMVTLNLIVSGDSTTLKQTPTTLQSIQRK